MTVCEGDTVVTEHVEHWEWPTGEKAALPFVSMQELRDGKIVRWWDYWDLSDADGRRAGLVGRADHGRVGRGRPPRRHLKPSCVS